MKSICVYCASSLGSNPKFAEVAYEVGKVLAEYKIDVIYGGAKVGLMGKVAQGAQENGGKIIGIIPQFLKTKEVVHESLNELITVETMHERKALMQEKSEGFIALPGGFGTMEELFEILTWAQLSLHKKPIGILNIDGFYDPLIRLIETMLENGVLKPDHLKLILVSDTIEDLLSQMNLYEAPYHIDWSKNNLF